MADQKHTIENIVKGILAGEKRALARGITIIENNHAGKEDLLSHLYPKIGRAHRIGVAGPPGVGKSTLTLQIAKAYRAKNRTVGIVAVDPTSPFTGGALLGDRIRMNELFNDPGVFIRSMATRGSMGGLAIAATEAADLLDAAGKSVVIFETVGIGQSELDIAEASDTVLLTLAPESGDGVQAMKAGFMEIADIFIVNKSDREGADKTVVDINTVISLRQEQEREIPVLQTVASADKGIDEVVQRIEEHIDYLKKNDILNRRRREQTVKRVRTIIRTLLKEEFWSEDRLKKFEKVINIAQNRRSPYSLARELVEHFISSVGNNH